MLFDVKLDVFGVQKALQNQVKDISAYAQNYKNVGVGRDDGNFKDEHMSIFWNIDIIDMIEWGTFWLSETPDVPSFGWDAACRRTATWAMMMDKRNDKIFYFVNTHLDHEGGEAKSNGLKLIVDKMSEINNEDYPMILTGDFNTKPTNERLNVLKGKMENTRDIAKSTENQGTTNAFGTIDPYIIDGFLLT